ncbi:MAG TPA: glycosyltransferase family 4 protein [Solirubrobacteraceae bacterium]|nr:glycosyltransferase family 4 protein [Solirubrobacteraceae bacterium]
MDPPDPQLVRDPASLRIALLTPCFWPEVRRGGERFVRELADGLLVRGHRPTLITSHRGFPRRTVEDGLPILRLPRPPQGRLLRRHYEPYLTHIPLSYMALCAQEYDLAHAVHPPDAMAAIRWKRRTGRPAILSYLGIPDRKGLTEYRRRLDLLVRAGAGADAVVALSRYAADAFSYWLGIEARVISPGVNLDGFHLRSERSPVPTIICSAAPEVPRKNIGLLIKAFALLRRRHPDARLILSRPRDPQAARSADVDLEAPGVEWRNLDDRADLARAYGESWVAALPSSDEAFGLVIVEALACGTPVVGYAHAAIPEVIDSDEIGRLFEQLDPGELARALSDCFELAGDPATQDRCRTRAEDFSVDRCVEAYLSLYRDLLGQPVGSSQPAVPLVQ